MRHPFFLIVLLCIFLQSCFPEEPDTLGDVLVRVNLPDTAPDTNFIVGVFPLESLDDDEFSLAFAIKTAALRDERAVITNILPGIYVVAFVSETASNPDPRQVIQIVADEVSLVNFDLNPLSND